MRSEPLARRNSVVIDDPKASETTVVGVIVTAEGKGVEGIKPSVI